MRGLVEFTLAASMINLASAVEDTPCYGYGNIMGNPSRFLEDDYDKVTELKVGQGNTYVGYLNYLFEGKNNVQLAYLKKDDEDFRDVGYLHGAKTHTSEKRYTFRNANSRMLSPGIVVNETKQQMIALMFVEYFDDGLVSDPWALASFEPINKPYYDYIETVGDYLKESDKFNW